MSSNTQPGYLREPNDKKKIDKTTYDWTFELVASFFRTRRIVAVIVLLLAGVFSVQLGFFKFSLPPFAQFGAAVLLIPIAFLVIIELIVRTIGLVSELLRPATQALDLFIGDNITLVLVGKPKVVYSFDDIERILLTYNWRGILIHTKSGAHTYTLPLNLDVIEQKLDQLADFKFKKEIGFLESKEGNIRTIWYNKK